MIGIYAIRHVDTNRLYIGSSITIKRRWAQHRYRLKTRQHHSRFLQRAWDKYGPSSFEFTVLHQCSEEDLLTCEQFYLDALRPKFNTVETAGTNVGFKMSPEQCEEIGKRFRGIPKTAQHRDKISKALKGSRGSYGHQGRRHSDEARRKMSNAKKGQTYPPRSLEHRQRLSESVRRTLATKREASQ